MCLSKKGCVLMIIGLLSCVYLEYMIFKQIAEEDQQEWCELATSTYWKAHDECFNSLYRSPQCSVSYELEADLVSRCGIIVR